MPCPLADCCADCRWVRYLSMEAGRVVFNQGDVGTLFYIIASGQRGTWAGGGVPGCRVCKRGRQVYRCWSGQPHHPRSYLQERWQ